MSGNTDKKLDENMKEIVTLESEYDYGFTWYAIRVVQDDDGLYLMTDSGCSCYSAFEYVEGRAWREFKCEAGEQFMDHATGPLTSEQTVEELRDLVKEASGDDCLGFDDSDVEEAVRAIIAANVTETNINEEATV